MDEEIVAVASTFLDDLTDVGLLNVFLGVTAAMGFNEMFIKPWRRKLAREVRDQRADEELNRWLNE